MSLSPSDEVLKEALKVLRAENPTLGVTKLQALLLTRNPEWIVSEKRVKKCLAAENLLLTPPLPKKTGGKSNSSNTQMNANADIQVSANESPNESAEAHPTSRIIENLDIMRWTKKVKVIDFGASKGKGLVVTEEIKKGEDVWKEDPFVVAAEWDIFDLQQASRACGYCTTPLTGGALISSLPCATAAKTRIASNCKLRFCNRLCLTRAARIHPLLCFAANSSVTLLLAFARQRRWMAGHAVALVYARLLLANEQGRTKDLQEDLAFVRALAAMGVKERWIAAGRTGPEPDIEVWKMAHKWTVQAFLEPSHPPDKARLSKILRKPIPNEISELLLDFDKYSQAITSMSLNLEAHGGLYVLHSHLNHSCNPNISVRHFDTKTALSRITVRAWRDIHPGEELFISYVNPDGSLSERRRELAAWAFGTCQCEKCVQQEKEEKKNGIIGEYENENEFPGLEEELRNGLGLL